MGTTSYSLARGAHAVTALVALVALVLQLVLVVDGQSVLAETDPPGLATRLARFVAYFTIQSNVLVLVTSVQLARDPAREGPAWRVVRCAAVVGITVTGLVHFVLLRPLLDLEGWNFVADKLLHLAVPALAVITWLVVGPRPRVTLRVAGLALVWPVAWLGLMLAVGATSGWYPYPFLDPREDGSVAVVVACVGVTVLFIVLSWLVRWVDGHLVPTAYEEAVRT